MRRIRTARYFLLALLLAIIPISSAHAGVFISVGIAPPALPVYVQPPCPEPDMIWTPGYWAYDYDMGQYYWVPGAWVPAPYEGALWTPPYWGFDDGVYMFHTGYWGPEVGYYGGVNYGFGYMGVGFVGGEWREHHLFYNTAIVNVNRTYINNTYINNTVVENHTVVNYNHVAYSGGPHGVQHMPTPEERNAMQMPHNAPTRFQQEHMQEAKLNRTNLFSQNHGRPQTVALSRPLAAEHIQAPVNRPMQNFNGPQSNRQANVRGNENTRIWAPGNQQPRNGQPRNGQQQRGFGNTQPVQQRGFGSVQPQRPVEPVQRGMTNQQPQQRAEPVQRGFGNMQPQRPVAQQPQYRPQQQPRYEQPQARPEPVQRGFGNMQPQRQPEPRYQAPQQPQYRPQQQPRYEQPQYRPQAQQPHFEQPQQRTMPQYRPAPQQQPRYEARPQSMPAYRPAPQPQYRPEPRPQPQRAPEYRPAPQARPEGRPHR